MIIRLLVSKKCHSEMGLGPIAIAVGVSATILMMSLGGLAVSQFNQINLSKQRRIEISDELNNNALKITRKLIKTSDFVQNPTTKVWSAANPSSTNNLWKFGTASNNTLGLVNFASCDPRDFNPINQTSNSLTTCTKISTSSTFLAESNGRPRLQMTTDLGVASRRTLNAILVPPPTVDLKAAAASGVPSNGPISINTGEAVTLSWTSSDADSCTLSPIANTQLNHTGLSSGALNANLTFSLSCTGPGGSASDSVSITVITAPAPLADLRVAPPSGTASNGPITINSGEKVSLSWTSSNATACSVTPGSYSGISNTGIQTAALLAKTTFTLNCSGAGGSKSDSVTVNLNSAPPPAAGQWTWMRGSTTGYAMGNYGTKGLGAKTNTPGAKQFSLPLVDSTGVTWVLGGYGYGDSGGAYGPHNDIWKWDGTNWIWFSGSPAAATSTQFYGTKGIASPTNSPPGKIGSAAWFDKTQKLSFFGGSGVLGSLFNDVWKFDGANWIWTSGENSAWFNDPQSFNKAKYGTKGVASSSNQPGGRQFHMSWVDNSKNFWIFGGVGFDSNGDHGALNDLWKYDGTSWTWVAGGNFINQPGIYGIKGVTAPNQGPGSRMGGLSWIDASNNLWLYGGNGFPGSSSGGYLSDLWKFNGSNWTWIDGANTGIFFSDATTGNFGTKGVANPSNLPPPRYWATSAKDSSGNLWMFGGFSSDSSGKLVYWSDLWKFNGTAWTWMSGNKVPNLAGNYGTQEVSAPTNIPGGRRGAAAWFDKNNHLWIFGGDGYDSAGTKKFLNDLWRFVP